MSPFWTLYFGVGLVIYVVAFANARYRIGMANLAICLVISAVAWPVILMAAIVDRD